MSVTSLTPDERRGYDSRRWPPVGVLGYVPAGAAIQLSLDNLYTEDGLRSYSSDSSRSTELNWSARRWLGKFVLLFLVLVLCTMMTAPAVFAQVTADPSPSLQAACDGVPNIVNNDLQAGLLTSTSKQR